MNDQEQSTRASRRRLLKSVVAGGGVFAIGRTLPESWTSPTVKAVMLPAHAQMSPGSFDGLFIDVRTISGGVPAQTEFFAESRQSSILDLFISPAQAASFHCNAVTIIQINVSGNQADICLSSIFGDAEQGSTDVNLSTGQLRDIGSVGASTVGMSNMQVSSDASQITGDLGGCGSFTAIRSVGSFGCFANLTSNTYLSSPFSDQA